MNSNEIKTAADFTMKDQSSQPYAWIMEGSSPEALEASDSVEQFVRDYVKGIITAQYEYKASDKTIYKVWRTSGEFEQIVNYINENHVQSAEKYEVWLSVPAVYNAGEWRISQQVIGPRGGKSWQRITHGIAATGGEKQMFLTPGLYKETYWSNGWPTSSEFIVTETGEMEMIYA